MDRRVRLRPKDGVRGLYYGGGNSGSSGASNTRQEMLALSMSDKEAVEWMFNRPAASLAPNSPNFFTSGISSAFTDPFNQVISQVQNTASSISNALTGTFSNINSLFGNGSADTDVNGIIDAINGADAAGIGSAINANDAAGIAQAIAIQNGINSSDISVNFTDGLNLGFLDNQTITLDSISSLFGGSSSDFDSLSFGAINGILEPLASTDGLVFPYTPTVDFNQQIDYTSYDPTHTNQELHSYTRTKAASINVNGKFTIQNSSEASYALAAMHFCRTVSKMAFGQSRNAGTPPPVLLFSGYGDYVFNDLPVILSSYTLSFPDDVDYIRIPNTNSYMPALFQIQMTLIVQNTPSKLRTFNLDKFRSGQLLQSKGWA